MYIYIYIYIHRGSNDDEEGPLSRETQPFLVTPARAYLPPFGSCEVKSKLKKKLKTQIKNVEPYFFKPLYAHPPSLGSCEVMKNISKKNHLFLKKV